MFRLSSPTFPSSFRRQNAALVFALGRPCLQL
jgi:hypothetical protein